MADLPPFPDEPPPLPEGAKLGMPDELPEGAIEAAPITEDLEPSGDVAVDPETGERAQHTVVSAGAADPRLKAELEAAEDRRQAELRNAARGGLPTPVAVSPGAPSPAPGPIAHVGETPIADHKAAQEAYRAHMRAMTNAQPGETVEAELLTEGPDLEVESLAERREREKEEAKARYEARVAAMSPDEPVYVVGVKPPRPKVEGHTLAIGDIVPGAAYFTRLESWVNAGILVKA